MSVKAGCAQLICAYIDVKLATFNRGYYAEDVRYFYCISSGGKKDANGDPADMNLSMDMIRIFVSNNAAGRYG